MSVLKPVVTTPLSTKGQLILPKAVRDSRGWKTGDRISVEETPEGLLLRREREPAFPPTRIEDVAGVVKWPGPPVTLADMKVGAADGAADRFRRAFDADGVHDRD